MNTCILGNKLPVWITQTQHSISNLLKIYDLNTYSTFIDTSEGQTSKWKKKLVRDGNVDLFNQAGPYREVSDYSVRRERKSKATASVV